MAAPKDRIRELQDAIIEAVPLLLDARKMLDDCRNDDTSLIESALTEAISLLDNAQRGA